MADLDILDDEAPPERDLDTDDMFAAPAEPVAPPSFSVPPAAASPNENYTVLARKYRPRTFEDLIGQEAMVRTLRNAFATGRIAHAFMLTGVRGVGKTTTARLLARALNYERDGVVQPTVELTLDGRHDRAIIEGRHMDVLELDAASRTGVDDMRDLLDSVRYAPVEARNKIYVIDEVHMLSKGAFNALLKTLEEPPPHAKFIFATTEIRKVPVTILSRCQRFDLRRVEPARLAEHLARICEQEGVAVEADGLALIARAAEGSVRDGLSLLDQALVQAEQGETVSTELVREMLGLADRMATIELFELVMRGHAADALRAFQTLYGYGADPVVITLDLLEHAHNASVAKALGPDALGLPKDQAARLAAMGAAASAGTLSRAWSMLLKAHDDVRRAPDPAAAAEMTLLRLCYAADLPGPEEALRRLQAGEPVAPGAPAPPSGGGGGGGARAQTAASASPRPSTLSPPVADALPSPQTFEEVVALIDLKRDANLKYDVARFVRPISVQAGRIEFEPAPGAPADLAHKLSARLKLWTGRPWFVSTAGGGQAVESAHEREQREAAEARAHLEADPFVQAVMTTFPGAEIVSVRRPAPAATEAPTNAAEDDEDR